MGYLFLALLLLCGTFNGYCVKKTGGKMNAFRDAMM